MGWFGPKGQKNLSYAAVCKTETVFTKTEIRPHTDCLTFDGEWFPNSCQFTVGIDGNFVVEQSFVHDEGVELGRICPSTQSNMVTTATTATNDIQ